MGRAFEDVWGSLLVYGCIGGLIAALKLIRKPFLAALLAILGPSLAFGGQIVVNTFGGLDSQDSPAALQPYQAQDLLNVQLQPGMKSVYKRDGYGLFQSLPQFSTSPVHGGYHFQQTSGSDVQLWGSDVNLYGSVADATFVKLATGTVAATWQCTDNLGFAYCLTSNNDTAVKTDGSVANTSFQPTIPLGTMITSTPLQLVVAGVAGSLSTLNFSANNNFTNFTAGPLATDPYTEIINAPGSRLTHIAYYFGKVFWWKDQSFGYVSGSANQNTVTITIVSNQIGTLDNSSAYWNPTNYEGGQNQNNFAAGTQTTSSGNPYFNEASSLGGIFFRGQDNHIYQYDGYTLTRLTRIITPTITTANRRKSNSWLQTNQADFQAGSIVPTPNLSTTISVGDVIVSSFQAIENSSTQWTSGTNSNMTIGVSSISLVTNNSGNITNPDFESAFSGNWTNSGGGSFSQVASAVLPCGVLNPQNGSNFASSGFSIAQANFTGSFDAIDVNNNVLNSTSLTKNLNDCIWHQTTLTPDVSNIGKRVKFRIHTNTNSAPSVDTFFTTSDSYIWGGPISFYYATNGSVNFEYVELDNITLGSSTITSGSFTSQVYNTGFTSATYSLSNFAWNANTSTPTFSLQTATNSASGPWRTIMTSSATNAVGDQFVRYASTISITSTDNALTSITGATILARSTGTYYSAVKNAPNLTSWGTLAVNDMYPGISSITYFVRSDTNVITVSQSTPSWIAQGKNATVLASTGTYFQMRGDFYLSAATETPTLNDFTFNWFEGSASDKSYITYFQDAIWISESSGTATTDDVIYYLDLLNNAWLQFSIPANGFAVENNSLYFGSPSSAKIFKFGGVTTDNGLPINSYWKSKDFTGDDPTRQNEFQQADFIYSEGVSTNTYTYTLDQTTATVVSIPLFDPTATILRRGLLLPVGKLGFYYNFKVGDNSSNAKWVLLMHKVTYNPLNWVPKTK